MHSSAFPAEVSKVYDDEFGDPISFEVHSGGLDYGSTGLEVAGSEVRSAKIEKTGYHDGHAAAQAAAHVLNLTCTGCLGEENGVYYYAAAPMSPGQRDKLAALTDSILERWRQLGGERKIAEEMAGDGEEWRLEAYPSRFWVDSTDNLVFFGVGPRGYFINLVTCLSNSDQLLSPSSILQDDEVIDLLFSETGR